MARGVNKVILIGNLGQDPDIRFTQNQKQVANVNIATSEQWTDKQTGQKQEKTEWHRVVFFDRLAEIVGQYLKKGSKVYIEGKLQTRKWQNQQGVDQYTTEIVANEMQMLDGAGGGGQQSYGNAGRSAPADYNQQQQPQGNYSQGYSQPAQQPLQQPAPQPAPQQAPVQPSPSPQVAPAPQQPPQPAPQQQHPQAGQQPAGYPPQGYQQPAQPQQPQAQPYSAPAGSQPQPSQPQQPGQGAPSFNDIDDDIPF